jgi:hypothetical protein
MVLSILLFSKRQMIHFKGHCELKIDEVAANGEGEAKVMGGCAMYAEKADCEVHAKSYTGS